MKNISVHPIYPPLIAGQACSSEMQTVYDIVKEHGRELKVKTKEWKESEFFIKLF